MGIQRPGRGRADGQDGLPGRPDGPQQSPEPVVGTGFLRTRLDPLVGNGFRASRFIHRCSQMCPTDVDRDDPAHALDYTCPNVHKLRHAARY